MIFVMIFMMFLMLLNRAPLIFDLCKSLKESGVVQLWAEGSRGVPGTAAGATVAADTATAAAEAGVTR